MKNVLILLITLTTAAANAQTFKPFKVNLSGGLATGVANQSTNGLALTIEPKYGVSDHFDIGFRVESAFLAHPIYVNDLYTKKSEIKGLTSGLLTGTFLFGRGAIRPFIGAGLGIYYIAGTIVSDNTGTGDQTNSKIGDEAKLSYVLRAGLKIGHFTGTIEHNAIANSTGALKQATIEQRNSYSSIKLGIDFGGGRR